jgi:hypothetical protein
MKNSFVMKVLISPISAYFCFAIAFIFFRKKGVTIWDAIMFPLRRASLNYDPPFVKDIFTNKGIFLLILGSLIALFNLILF